MTPSHSSTPRGAARRPADRSSWLAPLRRRWWLVALSVLAVAWLAGQIAERVEPDHYAESVLLVPAGGPLTPPPGDADGAQRLARTYASVIPTDPAVLSAAAQVAGLPQEVLEEGLDVTYEGNTALFRISYTGKDPAVVLAAVQAVTSVVGSPTPPATIAAGSIQVVRVPAAATELPSTSDQAVPIGIVVGLGLGLLLAVALERSADHLDTAPLLARRVGSPSSSLRGLTPAGAQALLARWQELAGREDAVVSLVPAVEGQTPLALDAASRLAHLAGQRGLRVTVVDHRPDQAGRVPAGTPAERVDADWPGAPLTLAVSGVPGGPESGELAASAADLCVVVVRSGTAGGRVDNALVTMGQFGLTPAWALLVPGRAAAARRGEAAGTDRETGGDAPAAGTDPAPRAADDERTDERTAERTAAPRRERGATRSEATGASAARDILPGFGDPSPRPLAP